MAPMTHVVENQAPPIDDYDAFATDTPLREAVTRWGAGWAEGRLSAYGQRAGSAELQEAGALANRHTPVLQTHDRFGRRADRVDFHPAWHQVMSEGVAHGVHALAWAARTPGAHVARAGLLYLASQVEAGSTCPLAMTHAVIPSLRLEPALSAEWEPRLLSTRYDARFAPATEKTGALAGMAMTEKQGGSDVRSNSTRAVRLGVPGEYELTGHKWFCSAPMCDVFLTLAQAEGGLSCFLVPRFRPDGTPNPFLIQRLKDKLGNRSNASGEIEYDATWARLVGEEGQGVSTIIKMVHHTRLDVAVGSAGLMRHAVRLALHHATHRSAFGRVLVHQPLMRNVLADLALETEAALTLSFRLARAFDRAEADPAEAALARIGTAIAKYWCAKRCPQHSFEAMECLGGNGFVEESGLPRLYREAPVGSIWEGSGNVQCLDLLRALGRQPETREALQGELRRLAAGDRTLEKHVDSALAELGESETATLRARRLVEQLALGWQAGLLRAHAPEPVSDAFMRSRIGRDHGLEYGTLPPDTDLESLLRRAAPAQQVSSRSERCALDTGSQP